MLPITPTRRRFRRVLLASAAMLGTMGFADSALAACAVLPGGSGTVTNPAADDVIECTGSYGNTIVSTANPRVQVRISNATDGPPPVNSVFSILGDGSSVVVGGTSSPAPAFLTSTTFVVGGQSSTLTFAGGSQVSNGSVVLLGADGLLRLTGTDTTLRVITPVSIEGDNATLLMEADTRIESTASFAGSHLITGNANQQTFDLGGSLVHAPDSNNVVNLLNAGGGDDSIFFGAGTSFGFGSAAPTGPVTYLIEGGAGSDVLTLRGSNAALTDWGTTGIEVLDAQTVAGDTWNFTRPNQFTFLSLNAGNFNFVGDESLGAAGSLVVMHSAATIVRFDGTGSPTFNHQLNGTGTFIHQAGTTTYGTGSSGFTGLFRIDGGRVILNANGSLGTALIDNRAELELDGAIVSNSIIGTGDVILQSGNGSRLTGDNSQFTGRWIVNAGTLGLGHANGLGQASELSVGVLGTMMFDHAGTTQFAGRITGSGRILMNGSGSFWLSGANGTFSGTVDVFNGDLVVTGDRVFAANAQINISGGDLIIYTVANQGGNLESTITGSGGVVAKEGAGIFALWGDNSGFNGQVQIREGSLVTRHRNALGNGPVRIDAGARLILQYGGAPHALLTAFTGAGELQFGANNEFTLSVASPNFSGRADLQVGRVILNHGQALGTATIFGSGGTLELRDHTFANTLDGNLIIEKTSSGVTTLTGNNVNARGQFTVGAGTLRVLSASALGDLDITLGANGRLEMDNAASQTLNNSVLGTGPGAGTLIKNGAGMLTLGGPLTIGTLLHNAGTIRANGTFAIGSTTVAAPAILQGTGRINGNLINNGTVAPGNSIGTLTINGNYTHGSGAVLEIEFDAAGNIDLLDVTGTATLNGGTLRFVSIGAAEGSGGTFLRATGGVTGSFATVQTVGAQLPLAVIYQPTSAIMAPSVLTARPSTFNAQFLAAAETGLAFIDRVDAMTRPGAGRFLWLQGYAAEGRRSATAETLAYTHNTKGLGGGLTLPLGESAALGLSAGWSRGDIALGNNGGSGDQDLALGAVSLDWRKGRVSLGAGAFVGKLNQDTVRNVSFSGFSATVMGETDSTLYGGYARARVDLGGAGAWRFDGTARAAWVRQDQQAYAEGGASPLRLALPDLSVDTLEFQAGLGATLGFGPQNTRSNLRFELGGKQLVMAGDREIPVTFAASSAGVTLLGDQRDGVHGYGSVTLEHALGERFTIHTGYAGQVGTTDRHEARVGVRFSF